jgi:hypothetical protein
MNRLRFIASVAAAALFFAPQHARAENLSDAELWAAIVKANPGKNKREMWRIFVCHKKDPVCQAVDTQYKGLTAAQLAAYVKKQSDIIDAQAAEYESGRRKIAAAPPTPTTKPAKIADGEFRTEAHFLVRQSLEDINTLTAPKPTKDVTGAQFSYNRDNLSPNTVWSARGVVAVPIYGHYGPPSKDDRYSVRPAFAVAPFISFDKVSNSSATQQSANVNNLSFGMVSEALLANVGLEKPTDHYFRLKGGVNTDFEGALKSSYLRAEWEPVSTANFINAPYPLLNFNVVPLFKLRADYMNQAGKITQPVFADHNQALRFGPRVGFEIQPVSGLGLWPSWFENFNLVATYSFLQDTLSQRNYSLFDSTLTYNIDKDGNYAVSGSYRKGRLDETGARVEQIMVGLAIKLNDLPSVTAAP